MGRSEDEHGWCTAGRGLALAAALALGLFGVRMLWHAFLSDLTLAEDEAHYWLWSTRPDWAYYSKGPGTAWLIALSTALFGHSEWAVRLPAALASSVGMMGAAMAARWTLPGDGRAVVLAAALYALVPGFAVASMLMTIDAPFLGCWVWGGALAVLALRTNRAVAWIGLGGCVGVGLLFKHTIVLLPLGVLLAWWSVPGRPRPRIGALAGAVIAAAAGLLPMLLWNAAHDWVTVRHLLGHLSLPGGDTPASGDWSFVWPLEMVGVQIPVIGGTLALALIGLWRSRRTGDGPWMRAMVLMGVPVFAFYLLVALRTRVEGNWAMAGAATMVVPAAWTVLDAARRKVTWIRAVWWFTAFAGVLVIVAPAMLDFLSTRRVFGPYIPVHRVTGLRAHAEAVRAQTDLLSDQTGLEPFVMTDHYGRASQLAFYLRGGPPVYSASAQTGGRRSQFDLWPDTDLSRGETTRALSGRPAVLIGSPGQEWGAAFGFIEPLGPLEGEPNPGSRAAFLGYGYTGFHARGRPDG